MNEQLNDPFENFDFAEKRLLYGGLLAIVKANSGIGFCNNDQGHPAYAIGRKGESNFAQWGDSPDSNKLFRMMHALTLSLGAAEIDGKSEISDYIYSWSDFCNLAYSAYERANQTTKS